jgi:hypothetical protein
MRFASHVVPPFVERENQTRVLHVELTLVPGSFAGAVQPLAPVRSVHEA